MAAKPSLRVYVVAFSGEAERLAATLQSIHGQGIAGQGVNGQGSKGQGGAVTVCVIGSDDQTLAGCAAQAGVDYLALLPIAVEPQRYWCTLLPALPATSSLVLTLRAGCTLPRHAIRRLCTVAQRTAATAIFPLSVRHPVTSAFNATNHQPTLSVDEVDRWLNRYVSGLDFDIPVFAGYCALFSEIPSARSAGDDGQLADAWRHQGALLIATDAIYVDDSPLPPLTLPAAVYPAWQDALLARHPLTGLRHALTELSARSELPPPEVPAVRPVRLHITHSWGGGLGRWVEDFVAADDAHQSLVLRPIGEWDAFAQSLALYASADMGVPLKTWTLAQPILSTALAHCQYRQIIADIRASYGVASVMVSSLIGHSLEVLDTGLATVFVCHDFYPVCPPLYATWETPCTHCDTARLTDCLQKNPLHRIFRVEPLEHWLALREAFVGRVLAQDISLVAPCKSVAQRMQSLVPALADKTIDIIEHGLSPPLIDSLAVARSRFRGSDRLRIVILGSLAEHKGAALLMPVLKSITDFADLILLGAGEDGRRFSRLPGITVVDRYERDQLGALLAEWAPDLGLLLSSVPETFSYTLSELHGAGVPVAATDLGAFADRIVHNRNGWLFAPQAAALLALLQQLHRSPQVIAAVRETLLSAPVRDSIAMVADYRNLEAGGMAVFTPLYRPREGLGLSATEYLAHGHLHINHQAPFRHVLRDFVRYSVGKVQRTERLPGGVKKIVTLCLGRWLK